MLVVPFYFYSSNWFLVAARLFEGDRPNLMFITSSKILTLLIETVTWGILNPIGPGLFSRSPGPRGASEARMPEIKVNINRLK